MGQIEKKPMVGVALVVKNSIGEILLGKRKGSHGAGKYALAGGHLEFGESFEECCIRELKEETNLDGTSVEPLCFVNNPSVEKNSDIAHYVTLYFFVRVLDCDILKNVETDKNEGWEWHDICNLPRPLFLKVGEVLSRKDVKEW